MYNNDKTKNPDYYDKVVSAQILDQEKCPQIYETFSKSLIHGPYGPGYPDAVFMSENKCSK